MTVRASSRFHVRRPSRFGATCAFAPELAFGAGVVAWGSGYLGVAPESQTMPVMKLYLELKDGKTHEFWQLALDGATRTITTGKIGGKQKEPKTASKTFKSADAARADADKELAKKKAALFFDPTSIEGILEAHAEQLAIPTAADEAAHRDALPYATEDYFRVYRTGALSIGFLRDFAPVDARMAGELGELTGLFVAASAREALSDEGAKLDPLFYVIGQFPDGSAVVQYNAGTYAGRMGVIEHGPSDELLEHLVEGDPDATIDGWVARELVEPVSTERFSTWVPKLLLHHKGSAVERLRALRAALATVEAAVAGDPLAITELDLGEKQLRTLPAFLASCTNLEVLRLRKNELDAVPPVIRQLKKLRVLDLFYNSIDTSALPAWLAELPLTELNLEINQGVVKPRPLAPVIPTLTKLEVLALDATSGGLPVAIGELSALRELRVSGLQGAIAEGGLGRLKALTTLELGAITAPLPADIGNLENLAVLKFEGTDKLPLPASIGRLAALRTLVAGSTTLTDAVCELGALEALKVGGNGLGLPEDLGKLAALRELDLHRARMTTLPGSFGQLQRLEVLNLEACPLAELPTSFAQLANLRRLNLATAGTTDIGDRLAALENLEFLALMWSSLSTIRGSLARLRKLETLKVYSRSSDEGDQHLLAFVHDLPALKLLGVPSKYADHFRTALPNVTID